MINNSFLKSQKNDIFEAIQKAGLAPVDFCWAEQENKKRKGRSLALIHQPSGYYYAFNVDADNDHSPEYSPGKETEVYVVGSYLKTWSEKLNSFKAWLTHLKREFETPDLWESISNEGKLAEAASASELEDTKFTADELTYVSGALKEIREYISSTQTLSPEMQNFIDDRLDYLETSSKRQDRKAWIHTTIGVLFTIVVGAAFSPNAARELFQFAGNVLVQVLKSQRLLP